MKLAKITAALGFAHLLGLPAASASGPEDDEKKQRADESDDDYAKRMEGDDKDGDEEGDEKKGAKKAEGDDDKKDDAKSEGGKEEQPDDEDDKEKAARASERARCAAIFASPAAGARPDMAAHLAFNTDMSPSAAVEMLTAISAGGTAQPRGLASRMAAVNTTNVGASAPAGKGAAGGASGAAAMIIEAGKKRRGEA
jgi:hypothetical protein